MSGVRFFVRASGLLILGTLILFVLVFRSSWGILRLKKAAFQPAGIINAHEHFQSFTNVPKFLKAMAATGIEKTVIVGSPEATILTGRTGFQGEEKYNLEVLKIANTYPDHFIAFPTIDVHDADKLEKLKQYMKMGGEGLKLYSGHSFFHDVRLDEPSMMPVYAYLEEQQIPVLFHVNAGNFREEFENVLQKFPKLKVICPHFCLSTINTKRFEELMDKYPNLYTDASFGYIDFLKDALLRISKNSEKYRNLIIKYRDRILFGTDMVVTSASYKTADWLAQVTRAYRDLLEKDQYTFFAIEGMTLRGLHLPPDVLQKIYRTNFERFMRKDKKDK